MRVLKFSFVLLLAAGSLCVYMSEAHALGALFSRPRGSDQAFNKMWIKSVHVNIDIQEQIAVTHVDQVFFNELNRSVETIFIFPLPEDAVITELVYWVGGQRFVAEIRELQEARNAYNTKLRQWLDPALLEYLGDNLFRLSIVPVEPLSEVRTEITYVEPLRFDLGKVEYKFRLNTLELSSNPLETVSLTLDARSSSNFKSFASPTHESSTATQIYKISDSHYTLQFGDENFYPTSDIVVRYELEREDVEVSLLTYKPAAADSFGTDSFFALWITPPDSVADEEVIPKDIVFTVDVSSSMDGERISQAKRAMEEFLNLLNPSDRFNIVTFGTFVEKFKTDLVPADATNIDEARAFVFQLHALGLTNIDEALTISLQQTYGSQTSNNLVFLTDGLPTWGETDADSIIAHVQSNNTAVVRIFSFGVGKEVSRTLLLNISRGNHGFARFISSDDSIALVVNNHFQRISKPVLRDIAIDLGGLQSWDHYPKDLPDLFWGSQILYLGLYNNSGVFNVKLTGSLSSEPFEYVKATAFPDTSGGHRFVPRIWAKTKIEHILELIEIYGETDELVNQIIELSLRFQILTPYTAFYVDPDEDDDGDLTDVNEDANNLPVDFALEQNHPNPFNPGTEIRYVLPNTQPSHHVVIKIYDILGRLVRVLVDEQKAPGRHSVFWDGLDSNGNLASSGIYVYQIQAGSFLASKKMALIR